MTTQSLSLPSPFSDLPTDLAVTPPAGAPPTPARPSGGTRPAPRPSTAFAGLTYDAFDALATARFWAAALHVAVSPGATPALAELTGAPGGDLPRLVFRQVTDGRTLASPVHLRLTTSDLEAESRRLEHLGARRLGTVRTPGGRSMTLADPEGNAFELVAA